MGNQTENQAENTQATAATFTSEQGHQFNVNLLTNKDGLVARKSDGVLLTVEGNTVKHFPHAEDGTPLEFCLSESGRIIRRTVNGKIKGAAVGTVRGVATTTKDKNVYRIPAAILNDPLSVTEGASDEEKAAARKAKAARMLQVFGNVGITLPAEPERIEKIPMTEEEIEKKTKNMKRMDLINFMRDPANLVKKVVIPARAAGRTSLLALAKNQDYVEVTPQMVTLWFQSARDLMTEHFRDAVRLVEETETATEEVEA